MDGDFRQDSDSQNLGEEKWTDHATDRADAIDGALKLALRRRVDPTRHQGLHGGSGDTPEAEEGNGAEEEPAARSEREAQEAESAEGKAGKDAAAFAEAADEGTDEDSGDNAGADTNDGKGETDIAFGPSVAILGIENKDSGEGLLGEVKESHHSGEAEELGVRAEERERAEGVGHVPGGFGAALLGKRFGKNEEAVHCIGQAEHGGGPEGKAEIDVAEESANRRADDEAHTEGGGEIAELLGAFFGRSDVGDVGEGAGDVGGGDAGDDASDQEPFEGRRERHEDVVEAESEAGDEDDRAAAETVGPRAEDGRKNELHERPGETEIAGDGGGAGDVAAFEVDDEVRENGSDDAEGQEIEEDGYQDEDEGGATTLGLLSWGRGGGQRRLLGKEDCSGELESATEELRFVAQPDEGVCEVRHGDVWTYVLGLKG